jgi:predicted transposase YdaD
LGQSGTGNQEFAMVAEKEPGVKKAVGVLMDLSEDERNEMLQDARDRWLTDVKIAMNYKYRLGKEDRQLEIARNMKALGIAVDQIAASTGLSLEAIKEL